MELKHFIKSALKSIIEAVDELQQDTVNADSKVCPKPNVAQIKTPLEKFNIDSNDIYHQKVDFDISVSSGTTKQAGGQLQAESKIYVIDANIDMDGSITKDKNTANRIKFHIPIGLKTK